MILNNTIPFFPRTFQTLSRLPEEPLARSLPNNLENMIGAIAAWFKQV
jgi:hypothetical protein